MRTNATTTQRVLPADVHDALELSALAHDGIGAGVFFDDNHNETYPCCVWGHASFCAGTVPVESVSTPFDESYKALREALRSAGITVVENDRAVRAVNTRKGNPDLEARISFDEWKRELNVVRGDS